MYIHHPGLVPIKWDAAHSPTHTCRRQLRISCCLSLSSLRQLQLFYQCSGIRLQWLALSCLNVGCWVRCWTPHMGNLWKHMLDGYSSSQMMAKVGMVACLWRDVYDFFTGNSTQTRDGISNNGICVALLRNMSGRIQWTTRGRVRATVCALFKLI